MRIPLVSWLSFTLCHWIYLTIYTSIVSGQCREDQQSLLLQLKNALVFKRASSSKLMSWNQSNACCQWWGVTCDEDRHVIGLDLGKQQISGGLNSSSSLFGLQHLQHLDLSANDFDSEIPSSFNKLQNLTFLYLADAGFVGQIPTEISHLTKLVTFDLSQSTALVIPSLEKLVQNFTKIRRLYLDGVSISAHGQERHDALLQIPTLQELRMVGCDLSGPIFSSLSRLENISITKLDYSKLYLAVPETFANFRNLTTLSLVHCELIGMFPQKIFQIPTLSFIDISDNLNLHGFFPEFHLNGSLQTLSVGNTNFYGQLPNSIGNLRHLSKLSLSNSQFNGSLPNSLSNLTQLVDLDLGWNNFTGSVPSLGMCKNLQHISLSHNSFTGTILSANFEDLVNLNELYLRKNSFTGMIPSSLLMLPSLSSLELTNNEFEGQLNDIINASSTLELLDLSMNRLEGPIPISLFQRLTNLYELKFSYNKFSGTTELNMLSKLEKLETLDISHNNLTIIDTSTTPTPFPLFPNLRVVHLGYCKLTTFPQFLKNRSLLQDIDLSNNHIVGTIPRWIWNNNFLQSINLSYNYLTDLGIPFLNNFSDLTTLDFHSNLLHGPLPTLPQSISYLDFSNNNLSSNIPSKIGNYHFNFLYLANNNLQGHIPESICNASSLQVLDLSENSLTGTIPKCLIAMNGTLSVLDLGKNELNGPIDTFPGLCSLRILHLNGNSLHGKLPKYLANCATLVALNIGDNQIHDHFPCWLKNISTLHVLILWSNSLHGSRKCGEPKVAWPHLHIFDLASNNFDGRVPLSFFKTWKAIIANENDKSEFKPGFLQFEVHDYMIIFITKTK